MIASSRRSRSWLTTSSAPRYERRNAEQPLLRVGVEVVGRLVEQEQLAAGEEDAGQLDAAALATGERGQREVEAVAGQAEPVGEAAGLRLGRVAARDAERLLGAREPGDVAVRRVAVDAHAQLLELRAAASRPRPDRTWASPVASTPTPRGRGSWGR